MAEGTVDSSSKIVFHPKVDTVIHDYNRGQSYRLGDDPDQALPYVPITSPPVKSSGFSLVGAILFGGSGCIPSDSIGPEDVKEDINKNKGEPPLHIASDGGIADAGPEDGGIADAGTIVDEPDLGDAGEPPSLEVETQLEQLCNVYATRVECRLEGSISIYDTNVPKLSFTHYLHTEPTLWDPALPCYDGVFSARQNPDDPLCMYPKEEDLPQGHPLPDGGFHYCVNMAKERNRFPVTLTLFEVRDGLNENQVFTDENEYLLGAKCFERDAEEAMVLDENGDPVELPAINRAGAGAYAFTAPEEMRHGTDIVHHVAAQYAVDGYEFEGAGSEEEPGFIPNLLELANYTLIAEVKK
jgi:hypothetical protein